MRSETKMKNDAARFPGRARVSRALPDHLTATRHD